MLLLASVVTFHGRLKMTPRILSLCLIFFVSLLAHEVSAQSLGHYHLPSTLPQFCGLGYGPGHHAPMIRPTQCHPPRMKRYVRVPGCGACGALPMESFATCGGAGCHAQLDQLLRTDDYDHSPVTPEHAPVLEQTPAAEEESILPLPETPPESDPLFAPPLP